MPSRFENASPAHIAVLNTGHSVCRSDLSPCSGISGNACNRVRVSPDSRFHMVGMPTLLEDALALYYGFGLY